LAIPTLLTAAGLLLANAYADPETPFSWKQPILQSAGGIALALLGQALILDTRPSLAVPFSIMACGSCLSLVLVSTVRTLFPPVLNNQRKKAFLNQPALDTAFPFRWRTSTMFALVVVIAVWLLTLRGEVLTPESAAHHLIVVLVIVAILLRT
jgi:hypothetical protein